MTTSWNLFHLTVSLFLFILKFLFFFPNRNSFVCSSFFSPSYSLWIPFPMNSKPIAMRHQNTHHPPPPPPLTFVGFLPFVVPSHLSTNKKHTYITDSFCSFLLFPLFYSFSLFFPICLYLSTSLINLHNLRAITSQAENENENGILVLNPWKQTNLWPYIQVLFSLFVCLFFFVLLFFFYIFLICSVSQPFTQKVCRKRI